MMSRLPAIKYCKDAFSDRMRQVENLVMGSFELKGPNRTQVEFALFGWTMLVLDSKAKSIEPHRRTAEWTQAVYEKVLQRMLMFMPDVASLIDYLDERKYQDVMNITHDFCGEEYLLSSMNRQDRNTVCTFLKTVTVNNPTLHQFEIEEWEANEQRLRNHYNSYRTEIFSDPRVLFMRTLITDWLKDMTFEDLMPVHGSGTVAESTSVDSPLTKYSKWNFVRIDQKIKCALNISGLHDFQPLPVQRLKELNEDSNRTSRLAYVPKSYKRLRGVNPMPTNLMFWQLGVKRVCYDYARKHRLLSQCIVFNDQTVNQEHALSGSNRRRVDHWNEIFRFILSTIDLTAASDSVAWELVKFLFKDTPLYPWLLALRADKCEVPYSEGKRIVEVFKSAPMGDGLCFFVESIIFLAATVSATYYDTYMLPEQPLRYVPSTCSVYGDDIICTDEAYDRVIDLLQLLGFIPNKEKSFTGKTLFRESCGIEAYDGVDITPLRYSRTFEGIKLSRIDFDSDLANITLTPKQHEQYISKANQCVEYEYTHYRTLLLFIVLHSRYKVGYNKKTRKVRYARALPLFTNRRDLDMCIYTPSVTRLDLVEFFTKTNQLSFDSDWQEALITGSLIIEKPDIGIDYNSALSAMGFNFLNPTSVSAYHNEIACYDSLVSLELREDPYGRSLGIPPAVSKPCIVSCKVPLDCLIE